MRWTHRGIVEELLPYLLAFALIAALLIFSFVRQRAETPQIIVGPGARVTTAEKSDSGGGWAFGTGVVVTLVVIIGGVIIGKRQHH